MSATKKRSADEAQPQRSAKKPKKDFEKDLQKGSEKTPKKDFDKTSKKDFEKKPKKDFEKTKKPAAEKKKAETLSSLLKNDSQSFPRGGGSTITPLERKRLYAEADREALLDEAESTERQSKKPVNKKPKKDTQPRSDKPKPDASKPKTKAAQPKHVFPDDKLTYSDIKVGDLMDGRVTRVEDYAIFVQLRSEIAGRIALCELADDYNKAIPREFRRNQIIKVRVVDVDAPNKRVILSSRTSKTLSSTAPVKDQHITTLSQVKPGQIVRGFVKNVAEMGLFVSLSYNVTGFIRVTDLSDKFLDDWRSQFQVDQLVRGRIIHVDESANRVQMSLKMSALAPDFKIERNFVDFSVGDIVSGTVRKVEDFGAFIVIDNSKNVSGLCHRSEVAQTRVEDVRKLYSEGDHVKAKILTIDPEKRKISFGLKASYFANEAASDDEDSDEEMDGEEGVALPASEVDAIASLRELVGGDSSDEGDDGAEDMIGLSDDDEEDDSADSDDEKANGKDEDDGLDAGAFEWNSTKPGKKTKQAVEEAKVAEASKKPKSKKGKIVEDHTGDLNIHDPKTTSDFELLLLGTPNDATIWAKYIALKASEQDIEGARALTERALRTIAVTESDQKLEIWVLWFNLELQFGSEDTVDEVFKKACEVTDRAVIHERFASCCIDVSKQKARDASTKRESEQLLSKAQQTFEAMKKIPDCAKGPDFWLTYAKFLFNVRQDPEAGRALRTRAMQSVIEQKHRDLLKGFALLEFNCTTGDPEKGRTLFELLLELFPKRFDFWEVFIAAETKRSAWDNVRGLYERMTSRDVASKLKKKNARQALDAWERFEQQHGGEKKAGKVRKRRQEYEAALQAAEVDAE